MLSVILLNRKFLEENMKIILAGVVGVGKSTISEMLAKKLNFKLIWVITLKKKVLTTLKKT